MAIKKIEIRPKGTGDYADILYPKTDDTQVVITDPNNRFTATNLTGALDELFTFANNGKTDIATVIGSPATSGDTFAQLKTHIQNSKNDLATNLTAKGQTSTGTETLDALVDKVALVNTGKKFASGRTAGQGGTVSFVDSNGVNFDKGRLLVTGLTFKPSTVVIYSTGGLPSCSISTQGTSLSGGYNVGFTDNNFPNYLRFRLTGNAQLNNDGFQLPVNSASANYDWVAYE